jgi:hypothetical protein
MLSWSRNKVTKASGNRVMRRRSELDGLQEKEGELVRLED